LAIQESKFLMSGVGIGHSLGLKCRISVLRGKKPSGNAGLLVFKSGKSKLSSSEVPLVSSQSQRSRQFLPTYTLKIVRAVAAVRFIATATVASIGGRRDQAKR